ncbi:unnamed protein product [Cladocopium goreaui]|uniref:Uncharacterized protein n=1 Tax=Cladocopium goreaui TaxID=2562237 RepID=A0A9P1M342_9DINO|nr:unnamed protein product [Cladocopium goreaui]
MAPMTAVRALGFTPRMFEALILGDDRHMEALPSEHIATIKRHVHGNHMAEHWCPVIVENELGQRWALHLDPLLVRQHRIKVRQELFDVQEKRARMLRRIKDIRATLPKAHPAESRACWEKELHEAEQRLSEECLVRQFPNGVKHVTVFLEISQQMVQLDLVCRHLKTELWPRLERAGAQSMTLSTLGTGSRARWRDLEVECSQEGRQLFEEFLDKVCQERPAAGGQGKAICMAKRLRKAIDADALLGRGAALFVLCSVPADAAECEQLLCRGQFTLQITGVLGASCEDPEICYERLIAAAAPGSALHLWFGEDYWKAFRAARRQQLESLSGDAQDSLASDGEVVSGEMLELRVLERLMRECYVDEQRCEEELKIMSQVLAKELCEAHDVKAVRQSPRGFAPAVAVSSSSLQLEPEIVPHSVGLGELADIAFSWTAMGVRRC